VVDYPDGRLSIRYRGIELAYRTFDKVRQVDQGAIADNKRLGPILAMQRATPARSAPCSPLQSRLSCIFASFFAWAKIPTQDSGRGG
jgi:hypothetical protein